MAAPYQAVAVRQYPRLSQRETAEERSWSALKFPVVHKHTMAVVDIHFSPSKPHNYAVTSSNRVTVYDCRTNREFKKMTRFREHNAASGHFRADGKLLVAGDASGMVQVFDVQGRAVLRRFEGHTKPVHLTRYGMNDTHVFSGSDDMTVRCWDVPTETEATVFSGHKDYVRAGCAHTTDSNLFFSGSYDHSVKLWDVRAKECVQTFAHEKPVEAVAVVPSGSTFISAGGNYLRCWDLVAGKMVANVCNHQKTITDVCFDGTGRRLLSASLDRMVKVYDTSSWAVVHSIKYPMPLLSIAVSPAGTHLAVGMTNGLLDVRHKGLSKPSHAQDAARPTPRPGTKRFFLRGSQHKPTAAEHVVATRKRKKLKAHDKLLRSFKYGAALDSVLDNRQRAPVVAAVMHELVQRDGLVAALSGRNEESLTPVLRFLVKNINHPRFSSLLIGVAETLIDLYTQSLGLSREVDELFQKLADKVNAEMELQRDLFKLLGAIDAVVSAV